MVRITPIGINPKRCETCGEDEGATKKLYEISRKHSSCSDALRTIQDNIMFDDISTEEILTIIEKTIGPRWKKMKAEKPARGILKTNDFGDSAFYYVICDCEDDDDAHRLIVEVDDMHTSVIVYVTTTTKWRQLSRWKQIWEILTKGCVSKESVIAMDEETALNYSEVLRESIHKQRELRKNR